jgi:uncharacterized membrane protein YraQ (UPF0718 family)
MKSCCGGSNPPEKPRSGEKAPAFDLLAADFSAKKPSVASCCAPRGKFDYVLWVSLALFALGVVLPHILPHAPLWLEKFSHTCMRLALQSWPAILAGIVAMAILSKTPKELVAAILGRPGTFSGILRATGAGVLLDLCNHGILLVGMGLYKRGASLGQTIAFLIASPWNSLSLTLLLAVLIGWPWTLTFLLLSAVVGIITGWLVDLLTKAGRLPANPNSITLPEHFSYRDSFREMAQALSPRASNLFALLKSGIRDSRMVLRWLLLGFVLTAAVNAFVPAGVLAHHFGPTFLGLLLTLLATTLLEVCSEGSSPLAAELFHSAHAPGNAFAFLMAGAATDYTEMLSLKSTTGRWICALILPILSVPQVLVLGMLLNQFR